MSSQICGQGLGRGQPKKGPQLVHMIHESPGSEQKLLAFVFAHLVVSSSFENACMTLKMPDRIRWNIKHLAVNLEVGQFLEDLLEGDVLDEDQYDTVVEKESDKLESAKCVVRFLLKKTSEQIDKFLSIVEQYQPDVASHVAETMRKRREGVGAVGTAGGGAMGSVQSKSVAEKRGKPSRLSSTASTSSGRLNDFTCSVVWWPCCAR